MNSWILHDQLAPLIARGDDPALAAAAKAVHEAYNYPVDSLVLSSAGELIDHAGVMELTDGPARYNALLDAAAKR